MTTTAPATPTALTTMDQRYNPLYPYCHRFSIDVGMDPLKDRHRKRIKDLSGTYGDVRTTSFRRITLPATFEGYALASELVKTYGPGKKQFDRRGKDGRKYRLETPIGLTVVDFKPSSEGVSAYRARQIKVEMPDEYTCHTDQFDTKFHEFIADYVAKTKQALEIIAKHEAEKKAEEEARLERWRQGWAREVMDTLVIGMNGEELALAIVDRLGLGSLSPEYYCLSLKQRVEAERKAKEETANAGR